MKMILISEGAYSTLAYFGLVPILRIIRAIELISLKNVKIIFYRCLRACILIASVNLSITYLAH